MMRRKTLAILVLTCVILKIRHTFFFNDNFRDLKKIIQRSESEVKYENKIDDEILYEDPSKWWKGQQIIAEKDHPHVGAQHPNGTLGMIVDPSVERLGSYVRKDEFICHDNGPGIEGEGGYAVLQIIRNGIMKSRQQLEVLYLTMNVRRRNDTTLRRNRRLLPYDIITKSQNEKNVSTHIISAEPITMQKDTNHTGESNINNDTDVQELFKRNRTRLLCLVYTHYTNVTKHSNVRAVATTWGKQCDGFIAASNYTDHSVGAIDLKHAGEEAYGNMWQKVRSMWTYVYDNYFDDFDYFYICGDDTYTAIDNFRAYLNSYEISRLENGHIDNITKAYESRNESKDSIKKWKQLRPVPILLGIPMMWKGFPFPSGGAGYAMNNAALKLLVEDGIPTFLPNATDSREDVFVGSIFAGMGIFVADTFDVKGGARFFGTAQLSYEILCENKRSVLNYPQLKMLFHFQGDRPRFSEQQIGFHLKDDLERLELNGLTTSDLMYRYHALLYDEFCPDLDLFQKEIDKTSCPLLQ